MALKVGDRVRVICNNSTADDFVGLSVGVESEIIQIWEGQTYPYELDGYAECCQDSELELISGGEDAVQ